MTQLAYTLVLLFAPLPVLIVVARIRLQRKRVSEDNSVVPQAFAPKPESAPGIWLRRFSLPERTYLRQQAGAAKIGFYIVAWSVSVLASSTLLPGGPDVHYGWYAGEPAFVWDRYLTSMFLLTPAGFLFAIITALTAGVGLSAIGTYAINRTRPVTHRLLYWGRVGIALLTLLAGYFTGIAVSLALLIVLHGPVWQHLNANGQGLQITLMQMRRWNWMLNTSLARFLASVATSMSMIFSAFVLLPQLQLGRVRLKMGKGLGMLVGLTLPFYIFFSQLGSFLLPRFTRMFFIYGLSTKVPPPWIAALVPISITAVFLVCGRFAFSRSEP